MQAPQPGGSGRAPASRSACQTPLALGLGLDPGRRRGDVELDGVGDPAAAQHLGRLGEVIHPRVDAGQQVGLVDRDPLRRDLRHRPRDRHRVRAGDLRRHRSQVEGDLGGVVGVGVGLRRHAQPARDHRLGEAVEDAARGERAGALAQVERGRLVEREPADQGAPLGGHVGDRHPLRDRQARDARAVELDRRVEDLVRAVESAQGEDHVLADHAGVQAPLEHHLHGARHLPPGAAGGPDRGGIGAHHRSADRGQRAVHVRVRVGRHNQAAGVDEAVLDHQLVADAGARRVKDDALLAGKGLDCFVLRQVGRGAVLDVVVEGEHRL